MRIGTGWDLHRLAEGRRLILGGVHIPFHSGEEAHSDGDVLIHAIIDSILGAAAMGDIGTHFPPSDKQYKNISSLILLEKTLALLAQAGYRIINLDTTIILQEPKLKPYIEIIREKLAGALSIDLDGISVKAKTKENVDATGEGKAIESMASVLIEKIDNSIWV
ncbi:MAG: 2-C-methyl-D-erythritol 2,4-cyclodiphosphate synthase [Spirochaetia bacterium]|jgi:2-C-methyl-D-erythritol 2,4-cyclodiphosphate synthase|nr:2-C-methyl-D-erythritol 2,4-cyclodiphosphate synthase [Spirochaetia bacterium]